jgi:hypothetical protein
VPEADRRILCHLAISSPQLARALPDEVLEGNVGHCADQPLEGLGAGDEYVIDGGDDDDQIRDPAV